MSLRTRRHLEKEILLEKREGWNKWLNCSCFLGFVEVFALLFGIGLVVQMFFVKPYLDDLFLSTLDAQLIITNAMSQNSTTFQRWADNNCTDVNLHPTDPPFPFFPSPLSRRTA